MSLLINYTCQIDLVRLSTIFFCCSAVINSNEYGIRQTENISENWTKVSIVERSVIKIEWIVDDFLFFFRFFFWIEMQGILVAHWVWERRKWNNLYVYTYIYSTMHYYPHANIRRCITIWIIATTTKLCVFCTPLGCLVAKRLIVNRIENGFE